MATVFQLSFVLVAPFWALMILAPTWTWTRRIVGSPWTVAPAALLYLVIAIPRLADRGGRDRDRRRGGPGRRPARLPGAHRHRSRRHRPVAGHRRQAGPGHAGPYPLLRGSRRPAGRPRCTDRRRGGLRERHPH